MARLALRIISSRPLDYFLDRKEVILSGVVDCYGNDKYLQLLTLVGLENQRWPEDFLARSTMALVLLGVLRASGYFGTKPTAGDGRYTVHELYIGSLLLKHLQVNLK